MQNAERDGVCDGVVRIAVHVVKLVAGLNGVDGGSHIVQPLVEAVNDGLQSLHLQPTQQRRKVLGRRLQHVPQQHNRLDTAATTKTEEIGGGGGGGEGVE